MLVEKQTGVKPVELRDMVELPDSCQHVWIWFLQLHSARQNSGFGTNRIPYVELMAFFFIEGIKPEPWEIRLLTKIDEIAVNHIEKENERRQKLSQKKSRKPSK